MMHYHDYAPAVKGGKPVMMCQCGELQPPPIVPCRDLFAVIPYGSDEPLAYFVEHEDAQEYRDNNTLHGNIEEVEL